jgi:hypothetical protein
VEIRISVDAALLARERELSRLMSAKALTTWTNDSFRAGRNKTLHHLEIAS